MRSEGLLVGTLRPHERRDGRRKGYKEHSSTVYERLSPDMRARLDAMRANARKNTERKPK